MRLDLAILAALAIFGLFGLFSGAIRQLAQLAGLALAYIEAPRAAAALMPLAQKRVNWPPVFLGPVVFGVLFLLLMVIGGALARLALMKLFHGRPNKKVDHVFGLALGVGKGAAVIFVLLSIVLSVYNPQTQPPGKIADLLAGSKTVAFVEKHNLFSIVSLPALNRISNLLAAVKDPKTAKVLASNPDFNALMNDPRFQAALSQIPSGQSPNLNDAASLMANPQMSELLRDPQFVGRLLKIKAALESGTATK